MQVDLAALPPCPVCTSVAVSLSLIYNVVKERRNEIGLRIVEGIEIATITYRCSNYHHWQEAVA